MGIENGSWGDPERIVRRSRKHLRENLEGSRDDSMRIQEGSLGKPEMVLKGFRKDHEKS